jgi:hypothetical protein
MTTTADQMARQTTRAPDHMTIFGQVLIGSRAAHVRAWSRSLYGHYGGVDIPVRGPVQTRITPPLVSLNQATAGKASPIKGCRGCTRAPLWGWECIGLPCAAGPARGGQLVVSATHRHHAGQTLTHNMGSALAVRAGRGPA